MRGWLAGSIAVLLAITPMALPGPARGQARESAAPEISNFTIDPPFASPGGVARIRFEFRGAQGGLRNATLVAKPATGTWRTSAFEEPVNRAIAALGTASEGVVEAEGRHGSSYAPEQRGTTNLYELRVTDRAGRKSNTLSVSLEVRL
jgi:hypothetical protein